MNTLEFWPAQEPARGKWKKVSWKNDFVGRIILLEEHFLEEDFNGRKLNGRKFPWKKVSKKKVMQSRKSEVNSKK